MRALGLVITCVGVVSSVARADVLDKPALSATPAELLAYVKTAKLAATGETELRFDRRSALDDQGRITTRSHWITYYATAAQEPLSIEEEFDPAFEDRPVVRARVIAAGGQVTALDPAKVAYDDVAATASLDAPAAGSIVELELVTTEHAARYPGGRAMVRLIGGSWSAVRSSLELSAPARKAHATTDKLPKGIALAHQIAGGREIWRYTWTASAGSATVGISTVPSWASVAQTYSKELDAALAKPVAAPADRSVAGVVAWLHAHAKELPGDTFKLGGTATGRAATLVALLRAAGQRADVVLVLPAEKVMLPSYEAYMVPVVRAGAVWIDPADELQRPGVLPSFLQGKSALVLAAGTRDFITTPVSKPEDNLIREVRTFTASEAGTSTVREVSREGGVFERSQRAWFRDSAAEARKQMGDYVAAEYAGTLRTQTTTSTTDVGAPFEVTLDIDGAATVWTERDAIAVRVYPRAALTRIDARISSDDWQPGEFVWPSPYIHEVENRIVVPPGYTMPALTADRTRAIGSAQLVEHQEIQDRTLIVRYRFSSGKRRLSAAEATALHDELRRLGEEKQTFKLDMTASALAEAGKPREALAELERLVRLHPKEPLHHQQLSSALLRMGLGDAARREARAAVQLAPNDADAYVVLGYTLMFDAAGRSYGTGWDRAGAIAALQTARTLNPKHAGAAYHLSDAAIRNPRGRWAEAGSDPKLALTAARAAVELDATDDNLMWLVKVLVQNNGFAEAVPHAEKLSPGYEERSRWLVVLAMINQGAAAAAAKARELAGGEPDAVLLAGVDDVLTGLRRYDELRAFVRETKQVEPPSVKLKRMPPVPVRSADPKVAAMDVMTSCIDVDRVTSVFATPSIEKRFRDACARDSKIKREDANGDVLADSMQVSLTIKVTGDAEAWRAEVFNGKSTTALYLSLERGQVVAWGDAAAYDGVGLLIDRLLARGRDDVAGRVLGWLAQDSSVPILVSSAKAATTREQRQRTAGAMMAMIEPARALALFGSCKDGDAQQERFCHALSALAARQTKRWADVLVHDAAAGTMTRAWGLRAEALIMLGRFDEAERVCTDQLASNADESGARALLIRSAISRGDAPATLRWAKAIAAASDAADLNQGAWALLVDHRELPLALDLAQRAARARPTEHAPRNTLAALEAEVGNLGAAITDNLAALPVSHEPLAGADWFVLGRIAEQLGLTADAITIYRRATPSGDNFGDSYELATKRLAALHASH